MATKRRLDEKENLPSPFKKTKDSLPNGVSNGHHISHQLSGVVPMSTRIMSAPLRELSINNNQLQTPRSSSTTTLPAVKTENLEINSEPQLSPPPNSEHYIRVNLGSLKKAPKYGSLGVEGEAFELPKIMGLEVENFGAISFPLVDLQASELIKICEPAEFETHLGVRLASNAFQLHPSKIRITNPKWNGKIHQLLMRYAARLGIHGQVEVKMEKIVVFKQGSCYPKHRSVDKANGKTFASLVFQPPTEHTGGELVIYAKNGPSKKIVDFGHMDKKSRFSVNFSAYYADLEHEILQVKSGHRLLLVYSIIRQEEIQHPIINQQIRDTVTYLFKNLIRGVNRFGFFLKNSYTCESIRTHGLKVLTGVDSDYFSFMNFCNENLPVENQAVFYICLATMLTKTVDQSGCDGVGHAFLQETEKILKFEHWYDQNGKPAFTSPNLSSDFFSKTFEFGDGKVDEVDLKNSKSWGASPKEELSGGTPGVPLTKTTKHTRLVLVMWAKEFKFDVMLHLDASIVINSLYQTVVVKNEPVGEKTRREFEFILGHLASNPLIKLSVHTVGEIYQILGKFNDARYVVYFLSTVRPEISPANNLDFVKVLSQFGVNSLKILVDTLIKVTVEEIITNCIFILNLHQENLVDTAQDYLNRCVIPLFKNPDQLEQFFRQYNLNMVAAEKPYESDTNHYLVTIVKCLNLYPELSGQAVDAFRVALLKFMDETECYGKVFAAFVKERDAVINCRPILELFELRKKSLEKKLSEKPPFSWVMPNAKMEDFPVVEEFLRSDRTEMMLRFNYVSQLRNFILRYSDTWVWTEDRGFSANITERPGKVALIKKTKMIYQRANIGFYEIEQEIKTINDFFSSI